ncbi:hypothetical protein BES08_06535 [Novosphingobium resinovorum]|uniref:Uncharacterized protein n=2 Tax=Novosphingobium resinovorum TaxID=158500 RepID=A0A1D8A2W9_9SPHN|nr:hypothetical protein BES08_06535 [Novosphingobium resinovorum]
MSDEDDNMAVLVAGVMAEILGLRLSGRDLLEELSRRIDEGNRTAKDILQNPWNTSEPAARAVPRIQTKLNNLRGILSEVGPAFLAAWLEEKQLSDQLDFHRLRERGRAGAASEDTPAGPLEVGYQRIVDILIKHAGVTSRDGERVSIDTVVRAGRLIKRQAEVRWCDEIVSWEELSQARLLLHVCVLHGWSAETGELRDFDTSGVLWHHDAEQDTWRTEIAPNPNFNSSTYRTTLPVAVKIDPPGMPRDWTPESKAEMHPVLWDALPQDRFYRSFVRELQDGENLAFNWSGDSGATVPRYPSLEAMIRFDGRFKAEFQRAERRFRVLDGYRAEQEDLTLEDLARSRHKKAQELLEFCYPVASTVLFDTDAWDSWRPWGTLMAALRGYLECSPDDHGAPGSLVFAWAYFLKGRLAEAEENLPLFVREALFDWMLLPVPSTRTPAVRILIPRNSLKAPTESTESEV